MTTGITARAYATGSAAPAIPRTISVKTKIPPPIVNPMAIKVTLGAQEPFSAQA